MKHLKKHIYLYIFLAILLIGIFFRTYQLLERYTYAHDADLFGWIVKDIVVDHHPRLIGQLTSADGIYIGPLFYYMLIPFFLLTHMDPVGATIPITILGILNLASIFYVFTKIFNRKVGLIAMFLWAVSIPVANYDRWVVPSTPSNLWSTWYLFTLLMLVRGNYSVLPLLALLIGLIWNIHIALAPALLAVPVAMYIAKKWPTWKQTGISLAVLFASNLPLIVFEVKHHFSQTHAFITNFTVNHGGGSGLPKLVLVAQKEATNINDFLLFPQSAHPFEWVILLLVLLLPAFLLWKKVLTRRDYIPLLIWIVGVFLFFSASSTLISEYYLFNLQLVFLTFISLFIYYFLGINQKWRIAVFVLGTLLLVKNLYFFINTDVYQKGYLARKAVAQYIADDSRRKGYPCVSVNYITQLGENVGFRYFFYLDNLHVNQPKSGSPVYSIVLPKEYSAKELTYQYGEIGAIAPKNVPSKEQIAYSCSGQNSNLTDPMLGFSTGN